MMANLEKFNYLKKLKKISSEDKIEKERCCLTFYENIGIYAPIRIRSNLDSFEK
jgi:hypothetical protein